MSDDENSSVFVHSKVSYLSNLIEELFPLSKIFYVGSLFSLYPFTNIITFLSVLLFFLLPLTSILYHYFACIDLFLQLLSRFSLYTVLSFSRLTVMCLHMFLFLFLWCITHKESQFFGFMAFISFVNFLDFTWLLPLFHFFFSFIVCVLIFFHCVLCVYCVLSFLAPFWIYASVSKF